MTLSEQCEIFMETSCPNQTHNFEWVNFEFLGGNVVSDNIIIVVVLFVVLALTVTLYRRLKA